MRCAQVSFEFSASEIPSQSVKNVGFRDEMPEIKSLFHDLSALRPVSCITNFLWLSFCICGMMIIVSTL